MPDNQTDMNVKKWRLFDIYIRLILRQIGCFTVKFSICIFFGQVMELTYLCIIEFNFKTKENETDFRTFIDAVNPYPMFLY